MSHRMLQVNENLQRELSPLIAEMVDWEGVLVTVTRVLVTPDLRNATAWLSVLNTNEPQKAVDLLNQRSSEFYEPLSDRLRMKRVPRIEFKIDDQLEELDRLDSIIDSLDTES